MKHTIKLPAQTSIFRLFNFLCPATLWAATWVATAAKADDWMTWASTYTHDPQTSQRIDQYALAEQPMGPGPSAVQRSGYRNYRSTLQAGQSTDNFHVVEEWGQQVVPYEQWRFPYRPYGVPYGAWGPQAPYGIFNGQVGYGNRGFNGAYPGGAYPGYPGYPASPGLPPGAAPFIPRTPAEILPGTGIPPSDGGYDARGYGGYGGYGVYGGYGAGGQFDASRGFPLQPEYRNQPWYDGTYPSAPPIDRRPDAAFFYHPPLGRSEQPIVPAVPRGGE